MTPWKTLSTEVAFDRRPYLRVTREVVEVAPGHVIDDFWQVDLRQFVVVVPVLTDGRIMTMTSYRHGPRKVCLSMPGGFIDPSETPETAARRELIEETGLVPGRLIGLGDFVDNGNQKGGHGYYFLAPGCTQDRPAVADATEDALLQAMTAAEVDAALDSGGFGVIHHVAGWCLARRHPDFPAG